MTSTPARRDVTTDTAQGECDMERITIREAAQILGIAEGMVRYHMRENHLPIGAALKGKGRMYHYLVYREPLMEFVKSGGIWNWLKERENENQ